MFYLIGQVDGTLAAVYISNGNNVFNSKVSDYPITAVACEEKDDADNQIFYCGDEKGTEPSTRRRDPETSMSSSSTPGPPARSSPLVAWSSAGRLVNTRRYSPTPSLMTSTRTSWRTGPLTRSSLCSAREAP